MAIDRDLLNEKVDHQGSIRTGVYCTPNRETAIVVKAKNGKVVYLTFINGKVELRDAYAYTFARDYPLSLPNYPATRAVRAYAKCGLAIDPLAEKVFRAVLGG